VKRAIRFNTIDSVVALTIAFFVNAAILVLAAMVFFGKDSMAVPGGGIVRFGERRFGFAIAFLTLCASVGRVCREHSVAVALLASGSEAAQSPARLRPGGHGRVHALEDQSGYDGSSPVPWPYFRPCHNRRSEVRAA